jgi:hypothetical protein
MTDVFEVAKPKAEAKPPKPAPVMVAEAQEMEAAAKSKPKPRQPPVRDVIAHEDTVPVKKTRRKRSPRVVEEIDEHMLFMKLYNELGALPKGVRSRLLSALARQLT